MFHVFMFHVSRFIFPAMSQLHFKKVFWPLIRSGRKTTTIRRWSTPRIKPNSRCYSPGLGWLLIDTVEPIELKQLTTADAKADGFPTLASLRKTLRQLYPDRDTDGRNWFRVTFRPEE
jgi:hypothetical protein